VHKVSESLGGKKFKSKIELELCVWGVERQARLSSCNCRAEMGGKKKQFVSGKMKGNEQEPVCGASAILVEWHG
jgi:hypothetical protein